MPKARPSSGHGGYRRPSNPAPASGPGALSARTDGGPGAAVSKMLDGVPADSIGPFGAKTDLQRIQSTVPRRRAVSPPPAGSPDSPIAALAASLYDPTARPDEPLSAGAVLGPGPGPQGGALMTRRKEEMVQAMIYATGGHPDVMRLARRMGLA